METSKGIQFRVLVHDGITPGLPVRAANAGKEYLVRVPKNAKLGDSFVFFVTPADVEATKASGGQYVIETAVLEHAATRRFHALSAVMAKEIGTDLSRWAFLGFALGISFIFGVGMGAVYVIPANAYPPH